jgi:acetyl-CoA C-acetyltransferase
MCRLSPLFHSKDTERKKSMSDVYIVGACRTPIGAFGGSFKKLAAHKLGSIVIKEALERANVKPEQVDEVIMGCILQAGQGQGPARQASRGAGIPDEVPAWAINQLCGSGLKTVGLAQTMISAGEADCMVVGGMESMSQSPYILDFGRYGKMMGHGQAADTMVLDGLTDAFSGEHMGITAENIAEKYELTREEQDAYAAESQRKCHVAMEEGIFKREIVPVSIPQRKGEPIVVDTDEHPKPSSTADKLAKLRAAFKKDGTVTAGNASGINDGAAAVVVVSEDFMKKHNLKPMAKILSHATTGLNPEIMGMGPVSASKKALERANLDIEKIERAELNEAFAAQSLGVLNELPIDPEKVNVNGGAIALGHPIGASGCRILVTLLYELQRSGMNHGLAALCVGGGMGTAMVVER